MPRGVKAKSAQSKGRGQLLAEYNRFLERVRRDYGIQDTSNVELEEMCKRYNLLPIEVGPLGMYKERLKAIKDKKVFRSGAKNVAFYGIYNTMPAPPGEHWFCVYGNYKYDPLGNDASKTQEQPYNTDDCGQRCVAYLLMCKKYQKAMPL